MSVLDNRNVSRPRWRRRLVRATVVALVLWLAPGGVVGYMLTHRTRPAFAEPAPTGLARPVGEHRLATRDGQQIGAWFVPPERPGGTTVLLLHGKNRSRRSMTSLMRMLTAEGYGVMAISLRAHGDSTGDTDDVGWSARHDVVAAVEFIEHNAPGGRVVLCGTSLGSAAAVFAAGELGPRVHGYVLDSPYLDLKTAVRNRTTMYLPPVLDDLAYASLRLWASVYLPVDLDRISPRDRLADMPTSVPVLILAGAWDRHSPVEQSVAMAEAVRANGRVVVFERSGHSRLHSREPARYREVLLELLRQVEGK